MGFDSAIEAQQHKELLTDNNSNHSTPKLIMDRGIEKHARDVYTCENFYIFQNELWLACVDCGIENKKEQDGIEIFHIYDNGKVNSKLKEMVYNLSDHNANGSCKMFQTEGIPCKHIFCILKGKFLNKIPSKYLVNRWTKFANRKPILDIAENVLDKFSNSEKDNNLISDVWDHLLKCLEKVGQDKEKLLLVLNGVVNMEKQLDEFEESYNQTKIGDLQTFIGSNIPEEVKILPPQFVKTKGSGKRIKGGKEKPLEQKKKEQGFVRHVVNMLIMIVAVAQKNHLHRYKKNIIERNKNKVITEYRRKNIT
ncbi:unnamed protein product [Lathyrus sativus]|nr:unnamed protein product [Lathyrus sativus]